MRKRMALMVFGFCLTAVTAHAEMMPDEALQKDYDNCMGGATPQKDPQRAQYCDCVRDGMQQWTVDQYGAAASQAQQQQGQANAPAPTDVASLAKGCIEKVLH